MVEMEDSQGRELGNMENGVQEVAPRKEKYFLILPNQEILPALA